MRSDRVQAMIEAVRQGGTHETVAEQFGVTRQAVWDACRRAGVRSVRSQLHPCSVPGCPRRTSRPDKCGYHAFLEQKREERRAAGRSNPPVRRRDTHGTLACYRHSHCRCAECVAAHKAWCEHQDEVRASHPERIPHGTQSGYGNWGCRCEACVAAGKAYSDAQRERVMREAKENPDLIRHGRSYGYQWQGCRCPECAAWRRRTQGLYTKRKRDARS